MCSNVCLIVKERWRLGLTTPLLFGLDDIIISNVHIIINLQYSAPSSLYGILFNYLVLNIFRHFLHNDNKLSSLFQISLYLNAWVCFFFYLFCDVVVEEWIKVFVQGISSCAGVWCWCFRRQQLLKRLFHLVDRNEMLWDRKKTHCV